jgi:hypothetical protein
MKFRLAAVLILAAVTIAAAYPLDTHYCRQEYPTIYTKFYPCVFNADLVRQETRTLSNNIVFKCRNVPASSTISLTYNIQYANANTNLSFSVSSWSNTNASAVIASEPSDPVDNEILQIYGNWTLLDATGRSAYTPQCINYPNCLTADTTSPRTFTNSAISTPAFATTISTFIHDETLTPLPTGSQVAAADYQQYCQAFYVSLSIV